MADGSRSPLAHERAPRTWFRLHDDDVLPALIFIVLAALACVTPAQNDTWWHLRSGAQMWETGSFLTTEPFSHTASGAPLNNHWWLSQLTFYGAFALGGPLLLTLLAGGCALAAVAASWRLVRGAWEVRVSLLVWLLIATAPEWAVRPQVISLAFLVLVAHLIARGRLVWLPVVCLVWANSHALVIFGVGMAGAVAVEALLWSRTEARRGVAIAAAAIAAPMISPPGWQYWPQVLTTVSMSQALELHEYRMPLEPLDLLFWGAAALLLVLTIRDRRVLHEWSRSDRILLIAALGLAPAAMMAARNVAFFAVVAAPVLSRFGATVQPGPRRPRRPARAPAYALACTVVLVASVAVVLQWRGGGAALGWQPVPAPALEAVRRCPDPLFNHMVDGGFLMWALPQRRVFVDSRMEAYPLDLLQRSRAADLEGEYRDLFRDYRIACALVETGSPLHDRLRSDAAMTVVHADAARVVFARQAAAASPVTGAVPAASVGPLRP